MAEATPYLAAAPGAVAAAKALTRRLAGGAEDSLIDASIEALADVWETDEARDGIAAFFAKSPAPWVRK
jgi:methylglutaconyl-CoA hydratase